MIAAVQGTATAAGCQLVASCDLAVASADARFCTPGVNIGLFCSTPMVALSRNVARKHAMEMLLTGDMIAAQDGAAHRPRQPRGRRPAASATRRWRSARKIAAKSSHVVKLGKARSTASSRWSSPTPIDYTADVMVENMMARDAEEGISAFIEKRTPNGRIVDARSGRWTGSASTQRRTYYHFRRNSVISDDMQVSGSTS